MVCSNDTDSKNVTNIINYKVRWIISSPNNDHRKLLSDVVSFDRYENRPLKLTSDNNNGNGNCI